MVIYRKDGSVYTLARPNPLVIEQNLWDGEKIILHNLDKQEDVIEEPIKPVEFPLKIIEPVVENILEPELEKIIEKKEELKPKLIKTQIHYLLAQTIEHYDPLYEETRNSVTYKNKGTCEIAIIKSDDLVVTFWSEEKFTLNTIIYIPKDRRWWKITTINQLYECIPSHIQPSF